MLDPALPPPANNPRYWVACGGYFAYMFARVATGTSVRVVAASQLMDSPGQEPSVTLLDWTTGKGTARYWVLALLLDSVALVDAYVQTALTANGTAQPAPWASPLASPATMSRVNGDFGSAAERAGVFTIVNGVVLMAGKSF